MPQYTYYVYLHCNEMLWTHIYVNHINLIKKRLMMIYLIICICKLTKIYIIPCKFFYRLLISFSIFFSKSGKMHNSINDYTGKNVSINMFYRFGYPEETKQKDISTFTGHWQELEKATHKEKKHHSRKTHVEGESCCSSESLFSQTDVHMRTVFCIREVYNERRKASFLQCEKWHRNEKIMYT